MVPKTSTVVKVFGSRASKLFRSEMTLLEATTEEDESVEKVFDGLRSKEAIVLQSAHFSISNEACN